MLNAVQAGDRALVEQLLRLDYGDSRQYVVLNGLGAAALWKREDLFEVFAELADTEALSLALQKAAHQGDVARMAKLLKQGAEPNFVSDAGTTPLYVAAREGHLDAVRLLLQHGARTDLANPHSQYRYPVDVARDPAIKQLLTDRLTASPSAGMDTDSGAPEAGTSTTQ